MDAFDLMLRDRLARLAEGAPIPAPPGTPAQRARGSRLRSSRGIALLVGAMLVTIAAGGISLLDRLASSADLGVAWERAERLGLSETVKGRTVTLERAYMDMNRIVIGLSLEGRAWAGLRLWIDGKPWDGGIAMGTGRQRPRQSASLFEFETPPGIGRQARMVVEVPSILEPPEREGERIEGPWRFEFTLPNAGGTVWRGSKSDESAGVTLTLEELSISPTAVVGRIRWRGEPLADALYAWPERGSVTHRGERQAAPARQSNDGWFTFRTDLGSDRAPGRWQISIGEVVGDLGDGKAKRVEGPWVIEVDVAS